MFAQATEKDDKAKKKSAVSRTKSQVSSSRKESALIRVEIRLLVTKAYLTKLQKRIPFSVLIHMSAEDIRKQKQ